MRLLFQTMNFLVIFILFIFCFSLGESIDCGGKQIANTIIVDQQGINGAFKTIQAAIDSIKTNNDQWIKVHINPGTYMEKVQIPYDKPCIIVEGSGSNNTIITYGEYNVGSTTNTSTFISSPPNVIVSGITFENSAGADAGPAVAACFYGDKSVIFNCSFLGYQDTLYDARGRHYFKNCYIQGEVDFIFGTAQSYYEDCVMNATEAVSKPPGFVTASHRNSPMDTNGFVFKGGSIVGNGKVNLGRAWGPHARVVFWETYFTSVITDVGWSAWNYIGQEKNTIFAEVDCKGPGANTEKRVKWEKKLTLSDTQKLYNLQTFINNDGWFDNIPVMFL